MTEPDPPETEPTEAEVRLTPRLVDSLYTEAMLLADEARTYFDEDGREERDGLPPHARVAFACESLKVTTRIMHIVAWLLTQRAVDAGEIDRGAQNVDRRLGHANPADEDAFDLLPERARRLIRQSADLYERLKRIDEGEYGDGEVESPARALLGRLRRDLTG